MAYPGVHCILCLVVLEVYPVWAHSNYFCPLVRQWSVTLSCSFLYEIRKKGQIFEKMSFQDKRENPHFWGLMGFLPFSQELHITISNFFAFEHSVVSFIMGFTSK